MKWNLKFSYHYMLLNLTTGPLNLFGLKAPFRLRYRTLDSHPYVQYALEVRQNLDFGSISLVTHL